MLFIALHGDTQKRQCKELLESVGYDLYLLSGMKVSGELLTSNEIYAVPRLPDV